MTPADRPRFLETLIGLACIKPGKELTPQAIELWWNAMQSWSIEDFKTAANHLARSVQFMPSPYDFEQLHKAGRPTAAEAWVRARTAAPSAISNGHVTAGGSCGDPVIDQAVRAIGGYGLIYTTEFEKLPFLERRFCEHYEALQDATDTREAVPQIAAPSDRPRLLREAIGQLERDKTVQ